MRRPDEEEHWSGSKRIEFRETFPHASIVTWSFPARKRLPPVRLTWYDGGLKPPSPADLEPGRQLPNSGILFLGQKGTILSGFSGGPQLLPESRNARFQPPKKRMQRTEDHYGEFVAACKGGPPAMCEFGFGTYLTELTLLGNLAVRTGKSLTWDPVEGTTNDAEANEFLEEPCRPGWEIS